MNHKLPETEIRETLPSDNINSDVADALKETGVLIGSKNRSGTMVIRDNSPICLQNEYSGFEMLPISAALKRYDWLRQEYFFKAVPADLDEVVAKCASQLSPMGYFIRIFKGKKVKLP